MAQGYLQTVQQGANKSYQDLVDTAARLGAIQEEYKQRQAALEEQQKASIRSGVSQANIVGGTLGWKNMKDYYNYASNTGDWFLQTKYTKSPSGLQLRDQFKAEPGTPYAITPKSTGTVPTTQQPTLGLDQEALKLKTTNLSDSPILAQNGTQTAITPQIPTESLTTGTTELPIQSGMSNLLSSGKDVTQAVPSGINLSGPDFVATKALDPSKYSMLQKDATGAITGVQEAGGALQAEQGISASGVSLLDNSANTTAAAAEGGALSGAMASIGGLAGIGLGAYSAAETGLSVGNVSSMLGGGLMLASLMEGFAFLGPWGLGIGLAGGIASSIFGW